MQSEIIQLSAAELGDKICTRELSPVEIVQAHLDSIAAHNPSYRAFITVTADEALAAARNAETEISVGRYRGPLHGIPYGAKDVFDTAGIRTTHGSSFFRDNVPAANAECIARLQAAGAILIGKCNTHEFAGGSTTINKNYGTARNPWDPSRIVGGSSGGSACALAARLVPLTLGSDTGGSIRTPAALCGVVGLKPTKGRISIRGIYANVPTFDHAGPLARTVKDVAIALQALAGYDPLDPQSLDMPVPDYTNDIEAGIKGMRIAVSPSFLQHAEVDCDVVEAFEQALTTLRDLGGTVETADFDGAERFHDLFRRIAGPEFSEVHRALFAQDPEAFDPEVRERLEWSFKISLDDYVRGLREREMLIREVDAMMRDFDVLVSPSVPVGAALIATRKSLLNGKQVDYKNRHRPFLSPHNLTGYPAISLPMGFNREGLPLSLQIAAKRWQEKTLLLVAKSFEDATPDLRERLPELSN
jgi:aspartyl-tRNA(Asn)/glutamyl-tRNA(Gln) amidotransferase subunit A